MQAARCTACQSGASSFDIEGIYLWQAICTCSPLEQTFFVGQDTHICHEFRRPHPHGQRFMVPGRSTASSKYDHGKQTFLSQQSGCWICRPIYSTARGWQTAVLCRGSARQWYSRLFGLAIEDAVHHPTHTPEFQPGGGLEVDSEASSCRLRLEVCAEEEARKESPHVRRQASDSTCCSTQCGIQGACALPLLMWLA